MRALFCVAAVIASMTMTMPLAHGAEDQEYLYLWRDSSDRYVPVLDQGGRRRVLANVNSITPPVMSPDGSRVAFSGAVGDESLGRYALFVVRSNGRGLRQLTPGNLGEYDPAWSPDGASLAVAQNRNGLLSGACCRLLVVGADNGNVTTLVSGVDVARPAYSAKGSYLLYDTPDGVWRISPSGGTPNLIAPGGFDAASGPGEGAVAFIFRNGDRHEIRRVSPSGGSLKVLYRTSGVIENLEWRGDRIYFTEHTGLGYDGRRNVTLRSVLQAGSQWKVEGSFDNRVVGGSLARGNDEIFFYRDDGLFRYYQIKSDGQVGSPISAGDGYTTGWSSINAIDLDGDGYDEMFFYRTDGLFRYYNISSNGRLPGPMSAGNGYTRGWDTITALDMDGDGQDEIFFYRDDGLFRFYQISAAGVLPSPVLAGDTYSKGWRAIVGLDVDGDGQDEMFFYRSDGVYRIYDVRSDGILGPPIQGGTLSSSWTSISAIDLDGDARDELLFYRSNGQFTYQEVDSDGALGDVILSGSGYTTGWSTITSVDLSAG